MRRAGYIVLNLIAGLALISSIFVAHPPQAARAGGGWVFIHQSTAANINGNTTRIDTSPSPLDADSQLLITSNWNPGGVGGVYHNHPVGVMHNPTKTEWFIFNRDGAPMTAGVSFNVLVLSAVPQTYQWANEGNTFNNYFIIDHALLNNQANAVALYTVIYANPPQSFKFTYPTQSLGLWYDTSRARWSVYTEDQTALQQYATFNVAATAGFVHTTAAGNLNGNYTYLNSPLTNNRPSAVVMVAHNWNPGGSGGTYHNHELGVFYDTSAQKWAIFNQDLAPMGAGLSFNVYMAGDYVIPAIAIIPTLIAPPAPTLVISTVPPVATAVATDCLPLLPPRLRIGERGRVTPGDPNSLNSIPAPSRRDPNVRRLTLIPGGGEFLVVGGPVCNFGYRWWQVQYNGFTGWTAEGENTTYWLEPIGACQPTRLRVGGRAVLSRPGNVQIFSAPVGGTVVGTVSSGVVMDVIGGPFCAPDSTLWAQISIPGIIGWVVEATASDYAVQPQG